jgi:hypothetical protein
MMSEIENTPWAAERAPHGPVDVINSNGYDVVTVYGPNNGQIGNLFAAAPDLYEALQEIINTPWIGGKGGFVKARSALAKARGEQ